MCSSLTFTISVVHCTPECGAGEPQLLTQIADMTIKHEHSHTAKTEYI